MKSFRFLGIFIGYGRRYFIAGREAYFKYSTGRLILSLGQQNTFRLIWNAQRYDPKGYHKETLNYGSFISGYRIGRFAVTREYYSCLENIKIKEAVWGVRLPTVLKYVYPYC